MATMPRPGVTLASPTKRSTMHEQVASVGPYWLSRIAFGQAACHAVAAACGSASPQKIDARTDGNEPGCACRILCKKTIADGVETQIVKACSRTNFVGASR